MKKAIFSMQSGPGMFAGLLVITAGMAYPVSSLASESRFVVNHPAYQQECGSCHVAYPPQMLSAVSWRAVMDGLNKHFGTDASLDAKAHAEIMQYLERHAGKRSTPDAKGKPALRITETRGFVHEHTEELPRGIWQNPAIKTPANCQACHTAAEKGDYSERTLRMPKGVRK